MQVNVDALRCTNADRKHSHWLKWCHLHCQINFVINLINLNIFKNPKQLYFTSKAYHVMWHHVTPIIVMWHQMICTATVSCDIMWLQCTIVVMSKETIVLVSSGGHSRAWDTLVPPPKGMRHTLHSTAAFIILSTCSGCMQESRGRKEWARKRQTLRQWSTERH